MDIYPFIKAYSKAKSEGHIPQQWEMSSERRAELINSLDPFLIKGQPSPVEKLMGLPLVVKPSLVPNKLAALITDRGQVNVYEDGTSMLITVN